METKVNLYSKELDEHKEHGIEHANRIFKIPNHGWELKDENFEVQNGNIVRTSKGPVGDTKKSGPTKHSGTA